MGVLSPTQRKLLSDTVAEARDVLEAACAQRIASLGVAQERVPESLNDAERSLRRALRARARQLGSVEALASEAAYEHWHRMLFARYLADNRLLVDDQTSQAVSLEEIAEYAAELGHADMWEITAKFAAAMLPGIFRQNDPALQMGLPVETRQHLEDLLGLLPPEVITADDSLGWVYQYWQSRRKDEVNRAEDKVGASDLAPVTQLFTEHYMVRFLLENSLGAWWAARRPDSRLVDDWEYLRRADDGTPSAGDFPEWPDAVRNISVIDPCCGSGHFLVAVFGMLWRMRAEEECIDDVAAQDAVLAENIFGLELDPRCTQIATFALALEAWKAGGYRPLPVPNIACSGVPAKAPLSDWINLAGGDPQVESALTRLHSLFASADMLGSLIDPIQSAEEAGLESVDWHVVAPAVTSALYSDKQSEGDPASRVFGEAASGLARAAEFLARKYTLAVTNPPFLVRNKQEEKLRSFLEWQNPSAALDLATGMMSRWLSSCSTLAVVTPTMWLFLSTFERFRRELLSKCRWRIQARLGKGAFEAITGEVVQVALTVLDSQRLGADNRCSCVDVEREIGPQSKAAALVQQSMEVLRQAEFLLRPSAVIVYEPLGGQKLLSEYADVFAGTQSGDDARYRRNFWELPQLNESWCKWMTAPRLNEEFSGREHIAYWNSTPDSLSASDGAVLRGSGAWNQLGVLVARAGAQPVAIYTGDRFSDSVAAIIPRKLEDLPAVYCYLKSGQYLAEVRKLNSKVVIANRTLVQVPFDRDAWSEEGSQQFPAGLPSEHSNNPTQWLFQGTPAGSTHPLQVAVARLLGYTWPDQRIDGLEDFVDGDGIVCLPAVGGEPPGVERLIQVLARSYGDNWGPNVLDTLLEEAGSRPGTEGLSKWLRNGFFKEHCKVFSNRPFIWQIWDGLPDGFSVLVNYHKLDRKLLERLTHDYLGNWWLSRVRADVSNEVVGAEGRLAAGTALKKNLEAILEGEKPLDIFVRWKSLAEQRIHWEPDLNDGVRLNIRPFVLAGVLRHQPVVNWNKDRGKNPDRSDRVNDLHYTLAEKRAARGQS